MRDRTLMRRDYDEIKAPIGSFALVIPMRFPEVNGLRGIAILAVILHHLYAAGYPHGWLAARTGNQFVGYLGAPFTYSWMGVSLFFVLSGFVLYWPYANGSRTFGTAPEIGDYYRRRFKRLYPLFAFCVGVSWLFLRRIKPESVGAFGEEAFVTLTGLFHFIPRYFIPPANWVLWSLGVELWFSVLFPLMALIALRWGAGKTLVLSAVIALFVRVVGMTVFPATGNPFLNPIKDLVFGRLDDFAAGMFAAQLVARDVSLSNLGRYATYAVGAGLVLFGMICWEERLAGRWPPIATAFANLPVALGCGAILVAAIAKANCRGWDVVGSILQLEPLQLAGMMCYSLYVWHAITLERMLRGERSPGQIAAFLAVLALVSWLSYRYLEFGDVRNWRDLLPKPARREPEKAVTPPLPEQKIDIRTPGSVN